MTVEEKKSKDHDLYWSEFKLQDDPIYYDMYCDIESYMEVKTSDFSLADKAVFKLNIYFNLLKNILEIIIDGGEDLGKEVAKECINKLIDLCDLGDWRHD